MLLTRQQEFMLEVLKRLGCIRTEQLAVLVRQKFSISSQAAAERMVHAALLQLKYCNSALRMEQDLVCLAGWGIEPDRLEAIRVMLELVGDALCDFAAETPPILLRFVVEQPKPAAFAVVTNNRSGLPPHFFPAEKVIILLHKGERPSVFPIDNTQIFAIKQEDGFYRFLARKNNIGGIPNAQKEN